MEKFQERLLTDKRWFLYFKEAHKGPFSAAEIFAWTKKYNHSKYAYLWTKEWENWIPLENSELFQEFQRYSAFYEKLSADEDFPILWQDWKESTDEYGYHGNLHSQTPFLQKKKINFNWSHLNPDVYDKNLDYKERNSQNHVVPELSSSIRSRPQKISEKQQRWTRYPILIIVIAALISLWFYYTQSIRWRKLSQPMGISASEFEELQNISKKSSDLWHTQLAVALDQRTLSYPQFYLVSTLPEGSEIILEVLGESSTLVGEFHFRQQIKLVSREGLILVPPLNARNGGLAKGLYRVYGLYRNQVLMNKTYFLGGIRDDIYHSELEQYHEQLRLTFENEMLELNQLVSTLDAQLNAMNDTFESYLIENKNDTGKARSMWMQSQKNWLTYHDQISFILKKYRTKVLVKKVFLYKIATKLIQADDFLMSLNKNLELYVINKNPDFRSDASIQLSATKIKSLVSQLKEHMAETEMMYKKSKKLPWNELI